MNETTQIQLAQLKQLFAFNNRSLITSFLLAVILAYMLLDVIEGNVIVVWLSLHAVVSFLRIWLSGAFKRQSIMAFYEMGSWLTKYRVLIAIHGLVWGCAGFFLFVESSLQYQMFLIFMLMGLSSGATVSYSIDFVTAVSYNVLALVPLFVRLWIEGSDLSLSMLAACLLYLVYLVASARHINKNHIDSIKLRLEADVREQAVRESEERYRLLLNHAPVGILHYNADLLITYYNQRLADILQVATDKLVNLNLNQLKDQSILPALKEAIAGKVGVYEGPYHATTSSVEGWIHLVTASSRDAQGNVVGGIGIVEDVTIHKRATDEIEQLAFYDPLTNLPNRRLLLDRLKQALVASSRGGKRGALLFLDLDHFKTLNDTLGHAMGDVLLKQVAERLLACVREDDTVARLGGDEYVVMLKDLSAEAVEAAAQVEAISHKILKALNEPYKLAAHDYTSTPSIGVAMFSDHGQTREELLMHADIAMYQAKKSGRNVIRFFDPKMQEAINARASLEAELRKALERSQFYLHYQVQVDSAYHPIGAEVLIRWQHPERGLISPMSFIALAEETGLIIPIGAWVLETACHQLKIWQQDESMQHLTLSVNVSAKQFHQSNFALLVQEILARYQINPTRLKLELTESMLLGNIERAIATMSTLKDVGIRFSLDDFGTGYSSLQYLKTLPLSQLKIDQSFVRDIVIDRSDTAIVRTIVAMAQSLELDVIAEGVETEEQRELLINNGCTNFQGYLFGKPVSIDAFEASLKRVDIDPLKLSH